MLPVSLQLLALCSLPRFLLASPHRLTAKTLVTCVQVRRASPRRTLGPFLVSARATTVFKQMCAPCTFLLRPAHASHHTTPCCRAKPPAKPVKVTIKRTDGVTIRRPESVSVQPAKSLLDIFETPPPASPPPDGVKVTIRKKGGKSK